MNLQNPSESHESPISAIPAPSPVKKATQNFEASALRGTQNIFEDHEAVGLEEALRRRKIISAEAFHLGMRIMRIKW